MRVRRQFAGTCVGLDLSLTGAAACALPCPWDGDITRAVMMPMAGYKLTNDASATDQRERIISIRDQVLEFCKRWQARRIMVEDYAFSAQGKITMLAELCGVVKVMVWENWGVSVEAVRASQARKTLLQKLPQKDSKLFTRVNVTRLGGPAAKWNGDEADAFVIANHALSTVSTCALSFPGRWDD